MRSSLHRTLQRLGAATKRRVGRGSTLAAHATLALSFLGLGDCRGATMFALALLAQTLKSTVASMGCTALTGFSPAGLRTFPESIKADVIDWDEAPRQPKGPQGGVSLRSAWWSSGTTKSSQIVGGTTRRGPYRREGAPSAYLPGSRQSPDLVRFRT